MAWDRAFIKRRIKLSLMQDPDVEDGLLEDDILNDAIDDAMKIVADDCNLHPVTTKFAVRQDVYYYPIPESLLSIRSVWYVSSQDTRKPLDYKSPEKIMDNQDPTDTSTEPMFFSYPFYQGKVFMFEALAPPIYDYIAQSHVTTGAVRTIIDSGINFGRTLDDSKVTPDCVGHNVDDDSYGYVDILDMTTAKETGTADSDTTNNTLSDSAATFITNEVAVGDIICNPSTGKVTSYAFVTEVTSETELAYSDIQGTLDEFAENDTYKVGTSDRCVLSIKRSSGHPGLRTGAVNQFTVGDVKATMTGTTFTNTRCTGSSTSGAEVDDIAIASGGSHGKITAVASAYVDVDKWIGGLPGAGETVSIKECDSYQIESKFRTQRVMRLSPTPSSSDTEGSESIEILYNDSPNLPERDSDPIEIPERYYRTLITCGVWQTRFLMGNEDDATLTGLEQKYNIQASKDMGDVWKPPHGRPISPWINRQGVSGSRSRYQTSGGVSWNALDIT